MTFTLRPYQEQAIAACYDYLRTQSGNPLIVLPTGAGKSPVLAQICKDSVLQWGGRVLVLTHVKELVEQNAATLHRLWGAELGKGPVGIYSAGLGMRDTEEPVIVAGIQSVYSKGVELGRFDLVIIDEAQSIPADGDGMYRTLLGVLKIINPNIRMIGLTATPYRLTSGFLYGKTESLFTGIAYEIGVRELIDAGFLSHLRGKNGGDPDLSGVHMRGGEYISPTYPRLPISPSSKERRAGTLESSALAPTMSRASRWGTPPPLSANMRTRRHSSLGPLSPPKAPSGART